MEKKLKVWVDDRPGIDQDMGWATVSSYEPAPTDKIRTATLILHEGKEHLPVYSGEEVRAMVDEMAMHIDIPVRCIQIIRKVAAKHGITL